MAFNSPDRQNVKPDAYSGLSQKRSKGTPVQSSESLTVQEQAAVRDRQYNAGRDAVFANTGMSLTDQLRQNAWNLKQREQSAPRSGHVWPEMIAWMKEDDAAKAEAKAESEKKKDVA